MINVFEPSLEAPELFQVSDCFQSNWVGRGYKTLKFEREWAKHILSDFDQVVSINSCTEALFTAVKLFGIEWGDEVIIPTIHFVGAAQAVINAGARPVFCDVDKRALNATAEHIRAKITGNTKAIILNHYGGVACDMAGIMQLLADYPQIKLIEDAACAPAGTYKGQAVGTFGDIGCWSFDAMKILSTGDGGMMYFKDADLAHRARSLLYLGATSTGLDGPKDRWWEFEVNDPGARRSIMNDIAAGMGLEQLYKLPDFIRRRQWLYQLYGNHLFDTFSYLPPDTADSSLYFYWIQVERRDELAVYLREQGIYTTFRYYPLHWAYRTGDRLPNAEAAARETLLLPLHQNLTDNQVEYICNKIKDFYE